jgi:hypothetical protein
MLRLLLINTPQKLGAAYKLPYELAETGAKTGYYKALGAGWRWALTAKRKSNNGAKDAIRGKENVNDTSNVHPWCRH